MSKDFNGITTSVVSGDKRTRVITLIKIQRNEQAGPPKLLVFKGRKFRSLIFSIIMLVVFGVVLFKYLTFGQNASWTALLAPIGFFGLIGLLLPVSEEWEYKPWQSQSQQVEQTAYD